MKIRSAVDEDYVEIARLRRTTIRSVNSKNYPSEVIKNWSTKAQAENFRESAAICKRWIAVDNEKIVGFCEHTFACEISRIYVHKHYLRKGIGSSLLKVAEDSLREHGCQDIKVESTITAIEFYEKNGYVLIEKTVYGGNKNAPVYKMLKKLVK